MSHNRTSALVRGEHSTCEELSDSKSNSLVPVCAGPICRSNGIGSESRMEISPNKRLTYFLAAGLLGCVAVLALAIWTIFGLQDQVLALELQADKATADIVHLENTTQAFRAVLDERREAFSYREGKAVEPPLDKMHALQPGAYFLATDTQYELRSEPVSQYQITHIVAEIENETINARLDVGLASRGLIPLGVYFDYNSDGLVDAEMVQEFVGEIPVIGKTLAKGFDPVVSQNFYSIFVIESQQAEYKSADDIADGAGAASKLFISFVSAQLQAMADWVLEYLPEQSTGLAVITGNAVYVSQYTPDPQSWYRSDESQVTNAVFSRS